jgi:hypothetical protein
MNFVWIFLSFSFNCWLTQRVGLPLGQSLEPLTKNIARLFEVTIVDRDNKTLAVLS